MMKAIAAVLKHDLGLPGGMLAEDAALKYQVARSTLFLRLKDWRVGKYMLPTDTSNRSEAQAILSPKAALGRDMREFYEEFNIKFKEAQVEWTAWKKANVPRAPRRTYTRRTPTTATSTPTTSLPQATSTPSTAMPLLPNDPLLQALTMPPILPSSSLPVMQLDNSYMDPFGTSMFNMSMGGMPLLPTVLPSTMQPGMPLPPLPMDPLVPLCAPLDGSLGAFGTTPMVLDSNSMAPSLPLLY